MIDQQALTRMVEEQISTKINDQIVETVASEEWLKPLEAKVVKYSQDRILSKFSNSSALPEIIDAVKISVNDLFISGQIPGIENFIDSEKIQLAVDQAVEKTIISAINSLNNDAEWQEKIENLAKQEMVQRIVAQLSTVDIGSIVKQRVDENFKLLRKDVLDNFSSTGIEDKATECQLTIMDHDTVIENKLTVESAEIVNTLTVKDLTVKGSINTDNRSWHTLANSISEITLDKLSTEWKQKLTDQVAETIVAQGIEFEKIKIDNEYLVSGNQLSNSITQTNIQKLGKLQELYVRGESHLNESLHVLKTRVGINTENPDSALSIWDEEVSIGISKYKSHEAYIGTTRNQSLNIGVNKEPMLTIQSDGLTAIKKLRVGFQMIGHYKEVPNWSGTRGDIIFNSNPIPGSAFAWVCLGAFKWKTLKAIE